MPKKIYVVWADYESEIELNDNPAADYYYSCVKHLRHLLLNFNERSNGLLPVNFDLLADRICKIGTALNIEVDRSKLNDQFYLNYLHEQYFVNVNNLHFDKTWLEFHDCIHLLEESIGSHSRHSNIWFDYLEKAGPLIRPMDRSWIKKYGTLEVTSSMCFLGEVELGKTPWVYKNDKDNTPINTTSKPWVNLKPAMHVATQTKNRSKFKTQQDKKDFLEWFSPYKLSWCKHWNIEDWEPDEIFTVIPIGNVVSDFKIFKQRFKQGNYPIKICL